MFAEGESKPALVKVSRSADDSVKRTLQEEAKLLSKLRQGNIHALIAPIQPDGSLVFEDCGYGFLDDHLLRTTLQAGQALKFAVDICNAMIHLEKSSIVHGDIAARNVLLTSAGSCKLTNLLAMANATETSPGRFRCFSGETIMRWPAPEAASTRRRMVSEDVWGYGLFLYELFTQGQVPYGRDTWLSDEMYADTMREVRGGSLLPQPAGCTDELYDAMVDCWEVTPSDRPTFQRLKTLLFSHDAIDELDSILSAATAAAIAGGCSSPSPPPIGREAAPPPSADSADLAEENARLKAELEQMRQLLSGTHVAPRPASRRSSLEPHPVGSLRRVKTSVNDQSFIDRLSALFPDGEPLSPITPH